MKQFIISFLLGLLLVGTTDAKDYTKYVDPFIGTGFHGHTYPGATSPFGLVQLSPDTRKGDWDACSGYHYSDSTLFGFSHTHLSGTGCCDLGDILIRPTTGKPIYKKGDLLYRPAHFSHKNEKASPGYYSVWLDDEKIKAELTATKYVGVHQYTFPKDREATIIVDLAHLLTEEKIYESYLKQTSDTEIVGMRKTGGWVDNQYVYFVIQISKPIKQLTLVKDYQPTRLHETKGSNLQAVLDLGNSVSAVVVKVGLSQVSIEGAKANLKHDTNDHFNFTEIYNSVKKKWNEQLGVIDITSDNKAELKNFYTALYHSFIVPNIVSDIDGKFRRNNNQIATAGHRVYSTFSTWDTFRAWHPMMTFLDTRMVEDMIGSMIDMYDATGELPIWPLASGETNTMIGYHSVSIIADAYLKGIRGFDAVKALEAMVRSSEINKKGAEIYMKLGYIPSNSTKESVSCLLEFAYDDWCIARMAEAMGKQDIASRYYQRAMNYVNAFDGHSKFFRGKRADGNWDGVFNPFEVSKNYTEATPWQYRFFVPHDINGLINLFGGQEQFTNALDSLFLVRSDLDGHLSDITGLIGQYAHGNEPSHHMAYLYNYVQQPWKTQSMIRRILHEMYQPTPEGIVGNEDCGQMSAWYILSSLGLYSVCPGSNEFVFTSPLFSKSKIRLSNGNTLKIIANRPDKNIYIKHIYLNGTELSNNYITYTELMQGGTLEFVLSDRPDYNRGTGIQACPYSLTKEKSVSIPYTTRDLALFTDSMAVEVASATPNCELRFTVDGSEPTVNSQLYTTPITITGNTSFKIKGFKEGFIPSATYTVNATKAEFLQPQKDMLKLNGVNYLYFEGNFARVADLESRTPKDSGRLEDVTITKAPNKDHFGYIFKGYIRIPETGVYKFYTTSDDGSVLFIDGHKIVDNDGSHAAIQSTGSVALKEGFHYYQLYYIEDYEGEFLEWGWILPGQKNFSKISPSDLYVE